MAVIVTARGPTKGHFTLDKPQRQFLLHEEVGAGRRQYEHHVGLFKFVGAKWIY